MATEKYISSVKVLNHSQEVVFDKLSNLKNLEHLLDPEKIAKVKEQIPNAPDFKLEDFEATEDACSFKVNMLGRTGMKIVERDPHKTIKMTGNGTVPFEFFFWIQLLPVNDSSCKIKLTLHAELNPMIKMMVNKHLKTGIEKLVETMTMIPFSAV